MVQAVSLDLRILVVAPSGGDARNIADVLAAHRLTSMICRDTAAAASAMAEGCGALLMSEEAMRSRGPEALARALAEQPPWSDVPVVLMTTGGRSNSLTTESVRRLGERTNLTLIERPLRKSTLVAVVETALRARRRQYEIRDLLQERTAILSSLEDRVSERTRALQETVSELEAFSYSISHDLRAPLRTMQSFAAILGEEFHQQIGPEGNDYVRRIVTAAARMDNLIQDILAYSRVTRLEIGPVDLDPLVRGIIESYPQFSAKGVSITIRGRLPKVLGHEAALTQCFSNLLSNAVKFVSPGTAPKVRISARRAGRKITVTVNDNGIGIPAEAQDRIFGIFQQLHKSYEGTGIGLAIVRKAVERMNGTVGVTSVPGRGSSFWLQLEAPP